MLGGEAEEEVTIEAVEALVVPTAAAAATNSNSSNNSNGHAATIVQDESVINRSQNVDSI